MIKIDCLGYGCPIPLIKLKAKHSLILEGEKILLVTDHNLAVENIEYYCHLNGFEPVTDLSGLGLTYSPVKGPQGNIEYLIYLKRACIKTNKYKDIDFKNIIAGIVDEAHDSLIN